MSSLKDLARECGVSVATVSKALNGQSDISAATRDRVRAGGPPDGLCAQYGGPRNEDQPYLQPWRFVCGRAAERPGPRVLSAVLDSFKVQVEKLGYDITFVNRNLGGRTMTYLEHCHYRGVDGAVIACVDFNDPQVVELVNSDVPVVTIDHVFNNRMAVLSDNVNGLSALVRYAYANGHRRIAFIHGERTAVTENRLAGFYKSCAELGLQIPEEYVRSGVSRSRPLCRGDPALLALPQRPTCILFPDDFGHGGCIALQEAGLSIPEDISVMGYDGIYLSRVMKPQLVTWQQNTKMLGRMAADKLVQMIEHPRVTLAEQIPVTGKLLEGGSVRSIE